MTPKTFQNRILKWFDTHGRKTLPWQFDKTPYRVWVSEIMLQQTQVSTVIPYYERFMQQFPDVASLARAKEDKVMHLWTGLGYYTRARNLHRTAKIIHEKFNDEFPDTVEALQDLPGIGRSTAGAILSIAFQEKATILDGNVKRVLTRLYGITEWPGEKHITDQLWEIAETLTPKKRVDDYSQAIMDLGATLCVRGKPQCERCPLETICKARAQNIATELPRSKPKKSLPVKQKTFLIIKNKQRVLLEKRPANGIWGGLWSLPEMNGTPTLAEIKKFCRARFGISVAQIKSGKAFRHTFSHFQLDIASIIINLEKNFGKILEADQQIWYNVHTPNEVGLPAPVKILLQT